MGRHTVERRVVWRLRRSDDSGLVLCVGWYRHGWVYQVSIGRAWLELCAVEALAAHAETFAGRASEYGPELRAALESGQQVTPEALTVGWTSTDGPFSRR